MAEHLTLPTNNPSLSLQRLRPQDAKVYFEAFDENRDHLTTYDLDAQETFANVTEVEEWLSESAGELRFGIWAEDELAGYIGIAPEDNPVVAEVGYWLREAHTQKGYATLALRALTHYSARRHQLIYAAVIASNTRSVGVLKRAGYIPGQTYSYRDIPFQNYDYFTRWASEDSSLGPLKP